METDHELLPDDEEPSSQKYKTTQVSEISVDKGIQPVVANDQALNTASVDKTTRILGVYRKKGKNKYVSEIRNPITKKKVWLGTFDTVEEASQAYRSKKLEFQKIVEAQLQQCNDKQTCDSKQEGEEKLAYVKLEREYVNCEQFQPESPVVASLSEPNDRTLSTASWDRTTRIVGAYRRKGKDNYVSEIKNPITKMRIWLGTFATAEEASRAYQSKKLEFQKLVEAEQQQKLCHDEQTRDSNQDGKDTLVNCGQFQPESPVVASLSVPNDQNLNMASVGRTTRIVGAYRKKGKDNYVSEIKNPITKTRIWLGTFATAEEASRAYQSKKLEFQKLVETQQQQQQCNDEQAHVSKQDREEKLVRVKKGNKTVNCGQFQPESPVVASLSVPNDQNLNTTSVGRTTRIVGVYRKKGKDNYVSEIQNPITKTRIWLGTFATAEEASRAYQSKKLEFQKLVAAQQQQQCNDKQTHDSNQDEEEKWVDVKQGHENVNCKQFKPESPVVASLPEPNDQTLNTASVGKTTHIVGVYRKKGKETYVSEIKNPINKKRIWLGTFATAEEASQAYQSKKLEFQKLVEVKQHQQLRHDEQTRDFNQDGKEEFVNVKQGHEDASCEQVQPESDGGSEIDIPISNSSNGGIEIGNAKEASNTYQFKNFDFQRSKKVELQSKTPTDSNQQGKEDEDLKMGQWVQLPGDREVKFSQELGLPIIDNYGTLLGEFSSLDNLDIC